MYIFGERVCVLACLARLEVGHRERYICRIIRNLRRPADIQRWCGLVILSWRLVNKITRLREAERLELNVDDRGRVIPIYILKWDDEVSWKDQRSIAVPKDARFPLNRLFAPETSLLVDVAGILCTLPLATDGSGRSASSAVITHLGFPQLGHPPSHPRIPGG